MPLTISHLSVGDPETEEGLRAAFEELGAPEGEDWVVSLFGAGPGHAWEAVLDGPARHKAEHVEWEIVDRDGGARFRRLFLGAKEQAVDHLKRSVRKMIWECVHFKENPIRAVNPKLGDAFEEAVWQLLCQEDMKPVQVRFGVWREGPEGMKFVCKVEYVSDRRVPWSWWSSLVRSPHDLTNELTRALAGRRKRQVVVAPSLRALGRRVARRGLRPGVQADAKESRLGA